MASVFQSVLRQLGGNTLKQISGQLGADEEKTGAATAAAVSTLLGALSRNASNESGAQALHGALSRDHDGSVLDNLSGFLGQAEQGPGEGILRHVLGQRRPQVEAGLSRSTGLDAGSIGKLLTLVAPVVLGALGKQQRQGNLDAKRLASMLGQERQQVERAQPQAMGLLGALLDADGDGDVDVNDVAKKGIGMLGKLFGR